MKAEVKELKSKRGKRKRRRKKRRRRIGSRRGVKCNVIFCADIKNKGLSRLSNSAVIFKYPAWV